MSYLWICFSLLCAATSLQSSASNGDSDVSIKCNNTVEVVAGENVTLNCSIIYKPGLKCKGVQYLWSNSSGIIQCNSTLMKYICGWNTQTYVYLTISHVTKEENYTIIIQTDCGIAKSSVIKVRVQLHSSIYGKHLKATKTPQSNSHVITAILGIFVTLAVVGILFFLFGTNRGEQIISRMKKEKTQGGEDSETRNEILLIP